MTRIVAGLARGRRLQVPDRGTRPTSERAREALFNTLRSYLDVDGAAVLDLYAGSGAVGLEALSRGARGVVFVESDRRAAQVLERNLDAVGLPGGRVLQRPVTSVLAEPVASEDTVELVFADPPYALEEDQLAAVLQALADGGRLAHEAMVVLERPARGPEPRWPAGIALVTERRYGEGRLWYGRARHG